MVDVFFLMLISILNTAGKCSIETI